MNAITEAHDLLAGLAQLAAADDLTVGQDGFNPHFSYNYMTEPSLFAAARAALAEAGLSGTLSFEAGQHEIFSGTDRDGNPKPQVLATVTAVLTVRDQAGNSVECRAFGQGMDPADKAYAKAMTMAAKYAVQKGLMIGVEHGEDTDSQASGSVGTRTSGGGGMSGPASERQLGFLCSLVKKHHIDAGDPEAVALRFARMQGDPAAVFSGISKASASALIEKFNKLPDGRGQEALDRLRMWEAENGYAPNPGDDAVPFQDKAQDSAGPVRDDDTPF